jgi:hypothetical protein
MGARSGDKSFLGFAVAVILSDVSRRDDEAKERRSCRRVADDVSSGSSRYRTSRVVYLQCTMQAERHVVGAEPVVEDAS